ncbi:hypothetical protein FH972_014499 [Carpinus fangiana]|uniref:Uncharacterized protein n=1 Tax=Carpinus fangiana TaxID=176857 RepID=A0A5N6RA64_9ROSI|nr:hypothetical protein FH972_014499 [Carpinus fangiana]
MHGGVIVDSSQWATRQRLNGGFHKYVSWSSQPGALGTDWEKSKSYSSFKHWNHYNRKNGLGGCGGNFFRLHDKSVPLQKESSQVPYELYQYKNGNAAQRIKAQLNHHRPTKQGPSSMKEGAHIPSRKIHKLSSLWHKEEATPNPNPNYKSGRFWPGKACWAGVQPSPNNHERHKRLSCSRVDFRDGHYSQGRCNGVSVRDTERHRQRLRDTDSGQETQRQRRERIYDLLSRLSLQPLTAHRDTKGFHKKVMRQKEYSLPPQYQTQHDQYAEGCSRQLTLNYLWPLASGKWQVATSSLTDIWKGVLVSSLDYINFPCFKFQHTPPGSDTNIMITFSTNGIQGESKKSGYQLHSSGGEGTLLKA